MLLLAAELKLVFVFILFPFPIIVSTFSIDSYRSLINLSDWPYQSLSSIIPLLFSELGEPIELAEITDFRALWPLPSL